MFFIINVILNIVMSNIVPFGIKYMLIPGIILFMILVFMSLGYFNEKNYLKRIYIDLWDNIFIFNEKITYLGASNLSGLQDQYFIKCFDVKNQKFVVIDETIFNKYYKQKYE